MTTVPCSQCPAAPPPAELPHCNLGSQHLGSSIHLSLVYSLTLPCTRSLLGILWPAEQRLSLHAGALEGWSPLSHHLLPCGEKLCPRQAGLSRILVMCRTDVSSSAWGVFVPQALGPVRHSGRSLAVVRWALSPLRGGQPLRACLRLMWAPVPHTVHCSATSPCKPPAGVHGSVLA